MKLGGSSPKVHHQGVAAFTDPCSHWHLNFSRFMIMTGIILGDEREVESHIVYILTSTSSSVSFFSNFLFHLFYYCFACGVWRGWHEPHAVVDGQRSKDSFGEPILFFLPLHDLQGWDSGHQACTSSASSLPSC